MKLVHENDYEEVRQNLEELDMRAGDMEVAAQEAREFASRIRKSLGMEAKPEPQRGS